MSSFAPIDSEDVTEFEFAGCHGVLATASRARAAVVEEAGAPTFC